MAGRDRMARRRGVSVSSNSTGAATAAMIAAVVGAISSAAQPAAIQAAEATLQIVIRACTNVRRKAPRASAPIQISMVSLPLADTVPPSASRVTVVGRQRRRCQRARVQVWVRHSIRAMQPRTASRSGSTRVSVPVAAP